MRAGTPERFYVATVTGYTLRPGRVLSHHTEGLTASVLDRAFAHREVFRVRSEDRRSARIDGGTYHKAGALAFAAAVADRLNADAASG